MDIQPEPKRYKSFTLYTNRNCMVFDQVGTQVPDAQYAVDCYRILPVVAQYVLDATETFYIAKWGDWSHEISQIEMEYLLGLRTKELDLNLIRPTTG